MKHALLPAVLACATAAAPCGAQRASADLATARLAAASTAPRAEYAPSATRSPAAPRSHSPVLGAVGGALVGGAMTFLVTQLAWSDWDASHNAEFNGSRPLVIAGGSALGALGGALLAHRTGRQRPLAAGASASDMRWQLISPAEIRQSTTLNAYDLVESLRPQWLRSRLVTSHPALDANPTARSGAAPRDRGGSTGWSSPERPQPKSETESRAERAEQESNPDARRGVRVYVERNLVGDVNALRDILVSTITSIEFLDTAAASYRLGQGNPSGAIVVHIATTR